MSEGRVWPALWLAPQKQGPQSLGPPCQPQSKDTSAKREVRQRWIIPRPSCNWATHPPTGKKAWWRFRESLQTKVRKDAQRFQEQSNSNERKERSLMNPQEVSFPRLTFLLKGLLTSGQRREFRARDFLRTGVTILYSGHDLSPRWLAV